MTKGGKWNDINANTKQEAVCISHLNSYEEVDFDMSGTKWRLHFQKMTSFNYGGVRNYCKSRGMVIPPISTKHEDDKITGAMNSQNWKVSPFIAVKGTHKNKKWRNANTNKPQEYFNWVEEKPKLKRGWYYGTLDVDNGRKWKRVQAKSGRRRPGTIIN